MGDTEVRCDNGWNHGCWDGDYCMPEGSVCPPVCYNPAPSLCMDSEVRCDNGMSNEGCWKGDYCMPEGSMCPAVCMDTDVRCDHGTNAGVWMGDYCMPKGSICPPACNTPAPSECMDTEV